MRYRPEHAENEKQANDVKAAHQFPKRDQRCGAELADCERNSAKRADWRGPHHNAHNAEQHLRRSLNEIHDWFASRSNLDQRKGTQHGNQQRLQHVSFRESANKGSGNNVHKELTDAGVLRMCNVGLRGRRIDVREIHVHPRLPQVDRR